MKTVILCGGRGTRLDEHGLALPKGLFPIGDRPLIWHLCKIYARHRLADFILCTGYLKERYSEYFGQDDARSVANGEIARQENWKVQLIDTGLDTNTGGRIKQLESILDGEQTFCVTYGDGLSDVDLNDLIEFHRSHGKLATLTAVNPVSNFGILELDEQAAVRSFHEKPRLNQWINGGFFVFERDVFDYLNEDSVLEKEPLEALARDGELMAYRHTGFWKCMDTFKDNRELNDLWESSAPWQVW